MEGLFVLGVLAFVGYCLYRAGKRTGSRKGYGVGRDRAREEGDVPIRRCATFALDGRVCGGLRALA